MSGIKRVPDKRTIGVGKLVIPSSKGLHGRLSKMILSVMSKQYLLVSRHSDEHFK